MYNENNYSIIGTDNLMVFAIQSITNNNEAATFERIVKECFSLFPKSFCLFRYPEWPDSNKVDRPLRKLREKGYITGNPQLGFLLTPFGERLARKIDDKLNRKVRSSDAIKQSLKGHERLLIKYIKDSKLFRRYTTDKQNFIIDEIELRGFLQTTLEASPRILGQKLAYFINIAKDCNTVDIFEFLESLDEIGRKNKWIYVY